MSRAREIEKYKAALLAALESDDFEWFTVRANIEAGRDMPTATVVEAFHKVRLIHSRVSMPRRLESQKWLADRGKHYENGQPIRIGDPLAS